MIAPVIRFALLVLAWQGFALGGALAADTLRVPGDYPNLRNALKAARDGDEILVGAGVYSGSKNKNLDFHGKRVILRSEHGPRATTIDCEGLGRAFKFHRGETPDTVLEGFTIRNGYTVSGGGVLCIGSSPTVRNCIFVDNTTHPGYHNGGGGMANQHGSHPVVVGCLFLRNRQVQRSAGGNGGGGMNNAYGSSPTVIECAFVENSAMQGGGMLNALDSRPVVIDCLFLANHAVYGGGMLNVERVELEARGCSFVQNSAGESAGLGIYNDSNAALIDCVFEGNSAGQIAGGAGSFVSDCVVINCAFRDNSAASSNWEGGGGGMVSSDGTALLVNCLFSGNNGGNGEAGGFGGGGPGTVNTLVNCTFTRNEANGGGALCVVNGAHVRVKNCILWDNQATAHGPSVAVIRLDRPLAPTTVEIDGCVVDGGRAYLWLEDPSYQVLWGPDNLTLDPRFANPRLDDFSLALDSPCIDAGDLAALPLDTYDIDGDGDTLEVLPLDLAGHTRVVGRPTRVDLGAFEFSP